MFQSDETILARLLVQTFDVAVAHPLLDAVRQFDRYAAAHYPAAEDAGLAQLGLRLLPKLANGDHAATPKNSLAFAQTGDKGSHFSFLFNEGQITDASPVLVTVPLDGRSADECNAIVAANLLDFLRLGLERGYAGLEQLVQHPKPALDAYSSATWQPAEDWQRAAGLGTLDESRRRISDDLARQFELTPLHSNTDQFERLQERYKPLLEYPTNEEWLYASSVLRYQISEKPTPDR
jgi:hypothetical protein